jgi:hypothetical protein
MKNSICIFLISFLFIPFTPTENEACGTVEGWVDVFFNDQHSMQNDALSMIHCDPVVIGGHQYKATETQHEILSRMIDEALKSEDACDQNLAVKNFFMFDQLYWIKDRPKYKDIVDRIEKVIGRPISQVRGELPTFRPFYKVSGGFDNEKYCQTVIEEIQAIRESGRVSCYRGNAEVKCKRIDLSRFERKEEAISSFISATNSCSNGMEQADSTANVIQVESDILNLREGWSRDHSIVKTLKKGEFLRVIGDHGEWFKVLDTECRQGWVAGYLTIDAKSISE